MSEDKQDIIISNQEKMIYMLKNLIRQRSTNKIEVLEAEVMKNSRMKTTQVMDFLNVTRQTALNLMEKLGKFSDFRYTHGVAAMRKSAAIVYIKSERLDKQFKTLLEMLSEKNITFNDIMNAFSTDIEAARTIASDFVESHPDFKIEDSNKIIRKLNHKDSLILKN